MSFDIFISYSSKDKTVADAVCARLESAGIRCWIAPRDVVPGTSYGEAIIDAIHHAKIMVLVFSSNANSSGHIPKEVERAVSNGVTILPFRIEAVAPARSLDYFIGSVHWLDAMTPPLEKHLDNLVTTIQKLLPALSAPPPKPGQSAVPIPSPSFPSAPTVPPSAAGASSRKSLWIGLGAAALVVAVVGAIWIHRGSSSGNSRSAASNTPVSTSVATPATQPNPPANPSATKRATPARMTQDPVVGCYRWFNNQPVVIHADGTMTGGPFTAGWKLVNAASRAYTFTWPEATDTVTISANQQSLSGSNQYGFSTSGTRIAGTSGLVGVWRWPNGVPVTVLADGTFSAATFRGTWRAADAARGIYLLTWPRPVDSVTLSPDGSRVSGSDQYGIAISGVKTLSCPSD